MKKRILFVATILCLFVALLPVTASAADDYPSKYKDAALDAVIDEWNFYNRECTSFVAWCLNSRNGVAFTNWYGGQRWGHAKNWGTTAKNLGITVDSSPAVGSVAWSDAGTYGHVAWVSEVNGGNVTIEEYNYNYAGAYHTRSVSASAFSGYIHIKDIESSSPSGGNPTVSQRYQGSDWNEGWYEGEWSNGKPNGYGKLTYDDFEDGKYYTLDIGGTSYKALSYEGYFANGFRNGSGVVTYEGGYREEGTFYGIWSAGKTVFEGKRWKTTDDSEGYWPLTIVAISGSESEDRLGEWVYTIPPKPAVIEVSEIKLNVAAVSMEVGDSATLLASVSPSDATDKTVTWSSSNASVATVQNGRVTAVAEGTATITAKAGVRSATCTVTVQEKEKPTTENQESEANDTMTAANHIELETEISGSIMKTGDKDWFVFTLPHDGAVSISFGHGFIDSSKAYWKTAFYTVDNKELTNVTWKGNATTTETSLSVGLAAGTYYLCVSESVSHSDATYRFTVNYTASDAWEKEFDDTIVTAAGIQLGTEISGSIMKAGDKDWFVFTLPWDGAVSISFGHGFIDSSRAHWKTAFYTADNKEMTSLTWKGSATATETGCSIGLPAGTYYLCISESTERSSETYRFKLSFASSDAWEKESNDTIVTATGIPLDTEISGSIMKSGDKDWFSFSLPQDASVTLSFRHDFIDSGKAYWKTAIYNSDNKELQYDAWKGNSTAAERTKEIDLAAGTYYICVAESSERSDTAYRFTVTTKKETLQIGNERLSDGAVGEAYRQALIANTTDSVKWSISSGALPDGLTLSGSVISGTPTRGGLFSFTVTASNAFGSVSREYTVTIAADTPLPAEVHFSRVNVYHQDQFEDVKANQWFTPAVASAFELGLMKGTGATTFMPYGDVTIAEAVTMAARIHSIATTGAESFVQTGKWYQVYLDYAFQNGIIDFAYYNSDVTQKATRAQFAEIFAKSLPAALLPAINDIADNAIPDVSMNAAYSGYVYRLYRAGILTGSDALGTFHPDTYITRAEAATVLSRMAESNNRVAFNLQ